MTTDELLNVLRSVDKARSKIEGSRILRKACDLFLSWLDDGDDDTLLQGVIGIVTRSKVYKKRRKMKSKSNFEKTQKKGRP